MRNLPFVFIKCAMSLDGYLSDTTDKRLILSNTKDFAELEKIRESCDAILIGAETLRKDNPKLILKSGKKLIKVTITASGNLDLNNNFFKLGESEKIVYTTNSVAAKLKKEIPNATIVSINEKINLVNILEDLHRRGIKRLLVEGGSSIVRQFLNENLVDKLQVSIAPITLGDKGVAKINIEDFTKHLFLQSEKHLDEMIIHTYNKQRVNNETTKWIKYVIDLSKKCPPSDTAFSVGAALVNEKGDLIADGYSQEINNETHAEEVIFEKIKDKNLDLFETTLYSSLEPCNTRLSKKESCVDLILRHRINHIVFAATEPPIFVEGHGAERLQKAGKNIIRLTEYEDEVIKIQSTQIQKEWEKYSSA